MKKLAVVVLVGALAACQSEPAEEPVVQDAPETAAALPTVANGSGPGTYLVTAADGTQMTAVINADGTYVDTAADGSLVAEGSWTVADGKTCFTPTTEGVQSMCYAESAPTADGSFVATPDEGEPVTVRPASADPAATQSMVAEPVMVE